MEFRSVIKHLPMFEKTFGQTYFDDITETLVIKATQVIKIMGVSITNLILKVFIRLYFTTAYYVEIMKMCCKKRQG